MIESSKARQFAVASALLALACGGDDNRPARIGDKPECNEPGVACTWLGLPGKEGFNGDGLHRLATKIYWSMDMLFASDGTPWFIDWNNHLVRRVLPDDTVETVVGWTHPVFPGDGTPNNLENVPGGAPGGDVQLNHPTDLAELPDGTVLLMAWHNHKLRAIDPTSGYVEIRCGAGPGFAGDGGPASAALLKQPKALRLDDQGNTYILDQQNFRIRKIDASGTISTIAGAGMMGTTGDGGPAIEALLGFEAGSNPEPSGGLAYRDNKLYISDTLGNRIRVVDLATGIIDTFAGTGEKGYAGDGGLGSEAQLAHPRDIEVGPDDALYVADTDNSVIRAIDFDSGEIRTVAGSGELGLDDTDARPATETTLRRPFGIAFDPDGHLYISDTINSRIVRVAR